MTTTHETIVRIRAYAQASGLRRATLAKTAGLHANTLRRMHENDWNPSAETLCRLEEIVPPDFEAPRGRSDTGLALFGTGPRSCQLNRTEAASQILGEIVPSDAAAEFAGDIPPPTGEA